MEQGHPAVRGGGPRCHTLLRELLRTRYLLPYRRFCREYDRVARRLDKALIGTYPSESTYKRWLSGRIEGIPRADACAVLQAMFPAHTVEQLLAVQDGTPDGFVERDDRVARTVADDVETDRAALDAAATVLADIRHLEDIAGPPAVLPITRSQHTAVTQLARSARGDIRALAVGLLSEIEQYLGWLHMAPSVECWEDSRRHLDRATILALEADDPMRLSTALSFAAHRNLRIGQLQSALDLNDAASRDDRAHVSLQTYNAFHKAAILVRSDSRRAVVTAMTRADSLVEQLPPAHELPASGYWYTPSFFHGERAFILAELGEHREAACLADEAIAAIPDEWANDEWSGRRERLEALL